MIRDVGTSLGRAVLDGIGRATSRLQERKSLPADLLESDEAYLAVFDGPGATAADISVRFEGNTLSVDIDRFREFYDGHEMLFPGRGLALGGEVSLPDGASVDAEGAEATLTRNGTLEVLIPKTEPGDREAETSAGTEPSTVTAEDGSDEPTPDTS